ncbi:MAG: hypothetical protein WC371_05490 [Parachlamydiales bacterium]|jgi:hypothetical protein
MKKLACFAFGLWFLGQTALFSVELPPWFGNVYEFSFFTKYTFSRFSKVESASSPLNYKENDHLAYLNLEFPFSPEVDLDLDLELMADRAHSFTFRSAALQTRYSFLDDIVGDPLSLAVGINFRGVSKSFTHDITTFYPGIANFEGTLALGKEFSKDESWRFRLWGNGGFGIADKGSPWVRCKLAFEGNHEEAFRWAFFGEGYHSYGCHRHVNLSHFRGYGSIRAKAIDLGFKIGYRLAGAGVLAFEYKRRVFAKRAPESVNNYSGSYLVSFSF